MKHELINKDSTLFNSYCKKLIDRIFKILPLIEQDSPDVVKYVDSLIFELSGLDNIIRDIGEDSIYISVLATLNKIGDEVLFDDFDMKQVRSEILKCTNLVEKLTKP